MRRLKNAGIAMDRDAPAAEENMERLKHAGIPMDRDAPAAAGWNTTAGTTKPEDTTAGMTKPEDVCVPVANIVPWTVMDLLRNVQSQQVANLSSDSLGFRENPNNVSSNEFRLLEDMGQNGSQQQRVAFRDAGRLLW